ncbi:hypothetical protein PSM_A3045 [Pseudoalteromonas sp. SM9913]|nr:hypothetical protein PSM_A3045 [Pseudoalteromonas sp. SM9913]
MFASCHHPIALLMFNNDADKDLSRLNTVYNMPLLSPSHTSKYL